MTNCFGAFVIFRNFDDRRGSVEDNVVASFTKGDYVFGWGPATDYATAFSQLTHRLAQSSSRTGAREAYPLCAPLQYLEETPFEWTRTGEAHPGV